MAEYKPKTFHLAMILSLLFIFGALFVVVDHFVNTSAARHMKNAVSTESKLG